MIVKLKRTKLFEIAKPSLLFLYNQLFPIKLRILMIKDNLVRLTTKAPIIMTIEESINYIIENKCSLSRFGDGELKLLTGCDIGFQFYTPEIGAKLIEILKNKEEGHAVGIPDIFLNLDKYTKKDSLFWKRHLALHRRDWYKYISRNKIYLNSFLSRVYITLEDKTSTGYYFELLKKIWDNKEIVIIEGHESRLGVGNDLFENTKSIRRILCSNRNAFKYYDKILSEAKKIDKNNLLLIALRPTATVLAFDLYKLGYQAIDIGHIDVEYEWFLMKAKEKVALDNKYVAEVNGGDNVKDEEDDQYKKEIICNIF